MDAPASTTLFCSQHAEFAALIGNYKYDLAGASIYVVRLSNRGPGLTMAKPCKHCQEVIQAAGIRKVYYTNYEGNVERLR
jgi:deoxycytidylate deaminase